MVCFLVLAMLGLRPAARATYAESAIFAFDTRDANSTHYANSALFVFDTRDSNSTHYGESNVFAFNTRASEGSGRRASGAFSFDTRNATLTSLLVTGPGQIARGQAAQFHAFAVYSDSHQQEVTSTAQWKIKGDLGTTPALANVTAGLVTLDMRYANSTPLCICASYQTFAGQRTANQNVLVLSELLVSATATFETSNLPGIYLVHLRATASGGTGAVTYSWDRNGDGVFGDASGASVDWVYASTGGTVFPRVRATDSLGRQREAFTKFSIDKALTTNQPGKLAAASSKGNGKFLDAMGSEATPFLGERVNNGLIVIAHGLYSDGKSDWVQEMAALIEQRIPASQRPNIICYDWEEDARPSAPSPARPEWLRTLHFKSSGREWNWTQLPLTAVNILADIALVRPFALEHGTYLGDRLLQEAAAVPPRVNFDAPIHFIGHSAGGFVVGEAAQYLRKKGKVVDRVTMLDTPVPQRAHLTEIIATETGLTEPSYVERIISSLAGAAQFPNTIPLLDNDHRKTVAVWPGLSPLADHFLAHRWYRKTIPPVAGDDDFGVSYAASGFKLSPFTDGPHAGRLPPLVPSLTSAPRMQAAPPLNLIGGFSTFGSVVENAGTYTITEQADAGIFKSITVPPGAVALRFKYRFTGTSDGDFLGVRFGARPEMFYADDLVSARSAFQQAEVSIGEYAQLTDNLVFTLVSRGSAGSVLEIKEIEITEDDDADGDGLTTAQELAVGSDPQARDTDLDGLDDNYELNVSHTNALLADSDGDGVSDATEILAGTNNVSNASSFAVKQIVKNANGSVSLWWTGRSGSTYRVLRSATPEFASFDVVAAAVPGVAPLTGFTDATVNAAQTAGAFYRVEVAEAPAYAANMNADSDGDGIPDGWELDHALNADSAADAWLDADGDGSNALLEFALGTDPHRNSQDGIGMVVDENGYLTLSSNRNPAASGLQFRVAVSGDLAAWFSDAAHVTTLENTPALLRARDNVPMSAAARRFIRLEVRKP